MSHASTVDIRNRAARRPAPGGEIDVLEHGREAAPAHGGGEEIPLFINHFYFYAVDRDFGPFFLKFGTYFPYNAKLCLNGHEYVKRQLTQRGIAYEALDNGILSCGDPRRVQALCDGLSAAKIEAFAILHAVLISDGGDE